MAEQTLIADIFAEKININWLLQNDAKITLKDTKKSTMELFFVAQKIKSQLPKNAATGSVVSTLQKFITNGSRRTFYNWASSNFDFLRIFPRTGKAFMDRMPASGDVNFTLQLLSQATNKVLYEEQTTINKILNAKVGVEADKPLINVQVAIAQHEEMKAQVGTQAVFLPDGEQRVLAVCQLFATGMLTVMECCERNQISYDYFINTINQSEHCAKSYEQAIRIANLLNNGRQISLLDSALIQLLTERKHTTETIFYEKITIPGQIVPVWREKKKSISKRDLYPGELITIKALLLKNLHSITAAAGGDEFTNMTEEELANYILEQDNIKNIITEKVNRQNDIEKENAKKNAE